MVNSLHVIVIYHVHRRRGQARPTLAAVDSRTISLVVDCPIAPTFKLQWSTINAAQCFVVFASDQAGPVSGQALAKD